MVAEEEGGDGGDAHVRQRPAPRRARPCSAAAPVGRLLWRLEVGVHGGVAGRHALVRRGAELPPHRPAIEWGIGGGKRGERERGGGDLGERGLAYIGAGRVSLMSGTEEEEI